MKNKNKLNTTVISKLVGKYGVSTRYIRQSVAGERTSLTSDSIKKDYKLMVAKYNEAIKSI